MKAIKRLFWIVFNAIQLAFTLSWSVVLISIGVLLALIGLKPVTHWLARFVWAPGLVYGAGGRIRVHGQLPNNGPFFLVMNHQSVIDIPVAMMVFKVPVHFIVKKELAKVPFLGWYIWAMDMVFVDRKHLREGFKQLKSAERLLARGRSIMCFAEGTRSRDGRIKTFKSGSFLVAIETKIPVIPVCIHGAREVLPAGGFRVRPGVIQVAIGSPIPTADLQEGDRNQLASEALASVQAMQLAMQSGRDPHSAPPTTPAQEHN